MARKPAKTRKPRKKKSTGSEFTDPVTFYARQVVAGKIVAGPHVRNECARHLKDIKRKDIFFDKAAALHAIDFFPDLLALSEGQFDGKPFNLHISQKFIVGRLFGFKESKKKGAPRRFRRAYIEQGKGNGKSPLIGGIGLYGMLSDGEAGAQIYAAAARKEQAGILFQDAVKMVRQSEILYEAITFSGQNPVWRMSHRKSGSFFVPISREAGKTGSGPRPHMALCDEVHEHPDRGIMEMLERGFKFREQPLLLMITNSGTDRTSVCWEEHEHAIRVAVGDVDDDTTFTYVCALDEGDDPLNDPTCWIKANPLLEVILTVDYLEKVVAQAKAIPGKLNNILRLHFCVWTDSDSAWISREAWEACEDPDMKMEDFEGQKCWEGLDLSATKDITGRSKVFEDGETDDGLKKYALFAHGYTPADTLTQRSESDRAPYDVWVDQGFLTATPGKVIRYDFVAADVVDEAERFELECLAYDRWLIKRFEEALDEAGATFDLMEHPQGITQRKDSPLWMPGSVDMFERLILEKRIRIQVNPALRSAVAGACFWTSPAGLRRFEKQKATQRIDLAVASAMAIGAATVGELVDDGSYLDDSEMVTV